MPKVIKLPPPAPKARELTDKPNQQKTRERFQLPELISTELSPPKSALPIYSYHIIEAIYTCHMWGVIRYGLRRSYEGNSRALALEAGSAMHEVFAAVRLWQLANVQHLPEHAYNNGVRIFGQERWEKLDVNLGSKSDPREHLMSLAFDVLHGSGYYDDPADKIRTITNMESATIVYVDEYLELMEYWYVFVEKETDPKSFVGIEVLVDAVLNYSDGKRIRYIGTADAVLRNLLDRNKAIYLGENKTASRLDDSWRLSFELSHQVTGYNVLVSTRLKQQVLRSKVFGLRLQPSQQSAYESFEPQPRNNVSIDKWARWVYEGVSLYERYGSEYEGAQRLTHSCNRYFRPCALITFCADTVEGRAQQIEQMVETDLSPSEQSVLLGAGI